MPIGLLHTEAGDFFVTTDASFAKADEEFANLDPFWLLRASRSWHAGCSVREHDSPSEARPPGHLHRHPIP
jgi:hypothetical protein